MADRKITELANITGANLADADEFVVVDASADETKAITFGELKSGLDTATGFVRITGDTMTGALDVQSTITADGLTVETDQGNISISSTASLINFERAGSSYLRATNAAGNFFFITGGDEFVTLRRMAISSDGDISFYEDTGTTAKFFWDASAESLTLGGSSEPSVAAGELNLVGPSTTNNTAQASLSFYDGGSNDLASIQSYRGGSFSDGELAFEVAQGGAAPAEAMRIDSSGNVGIGISNPFYNLVVSSGGASGIEFAPAYSGTANLVQHYSRSGAVYVDAVNEAAQHRFNIGGSEKMRIDSSGNVGIGTGSPSDTAGFGTTLDIQGTTGGILYLRDSSSPTTQYGYIGYYGQGTERLDISNANSSGTIRLSTAGTERMRLDSNGNLLVNRSSAFTTAKTEIQSDAGDPLTLALNTINTDGNILSFYKAGAPVGSIGSYSGTDTYVTGGSGNSTGVVITSGAVVPSGSAGATNTNVNLGLSVAGRRFKDLNLSNAVIQSLVKATTTATTQVAIETFAHASHDGAKVVITAATSADTYVTELLIATNGTTAVATEYGQIGTGSALATYDVDISGADVRILATPASTTSTTFRVAMTLT